MVGAHGAEKAARLMAREEERQEEAGFPQSQGPNGFPQPPLTVPTTFQWHQAGDQAFNMGTSADI